MEFLTRKEREEAENAKKKYALTYVVEGCHAVDSFLCKVGAMGIVALKKLESLKGFQLFIWVDGTGRLKTAVQFTMSALWTVRGGQDDHYPINWLRSFRHSLISH